MQRTGPLVRAQARVLANGASFQIEVPHLQQDARLFRRGEHLSLKLLHYSVFPRATGRPAVDDGDAVDDRWRNREQSSEPHPAVRP